MNLDDWQKEALEYDGDLLLCTGRRVGKTMIMAIKAIERMKKQKGCKIMVVSLTEDQAELIIAMALQYAEEKYKSLIGKGNKKPTKSKIHFNGGMLRSRPVGLTGDSVRGFTGDVLVVDEASRMPKLMWIAARPILLTSAHANLWLCSTPAGKQGYFWEKFDEAYNKKDPKSRFKVIYTTTEKVMSEREICESWTIEQRENALKTLEQEKRDMTKLEYGQEYMGLFLEELQRVFSDELIAKCCVLKRRERIVPYLKYYLGCDIARMGGDEITFEVIERVNKNFFLQRESIIKKRRLTTQTEDDIYTLHQMWRFKSIGIDAGAGTLGVSVLDHLIRRNIEVVALNNRKMSLDRDGKKTQKLMVEDMYNNLLAMMEQGKVKLLDDDEVIASLRSIMYEIVTKQDQPTRTRIWGSYSHVAEGIIRALWLANEDKRLDLWAA